MSIPLSGDVKLPNVDSELDVADFLKVSDDEKSEKEETTEEETKKETSDEDDELEIEDKEDEDKLDLKDKDDEIDAPPKKKEILKKYPTIFKDFPFLEKMIFRDRRIQERFGSFDDAMEAADKAETLDDFQKDLLSGNSEKLLADIKETDEKGYRAFVDNFLPTLAKVDKEAYIGVAQDITRLLIKSMVGEAAKTKDDKIKNALEDAALMLNRHIFGGDEFVEKRAAPKDDSLDRERADFQQERLNVAVEDMQNKVGNIIKNTIGDYIDPKDEMSPFVKRNAVKRALEILDERMGEDSLFTRSMNRLWKESVQNKLSKSSQDKIRSTWLGKAKKILPAAIRSARAEALEGHTPSRRENKSEEEEEKSDRRGPITPGRSTSSQSGKREGPKEGESVSDWFKRD